MLTVLMFHKVSEPEGLIPQLENFLIELKKSYDIVLPGDQVSPFKKYLCLSFDDAYFDFYHYVFPLLKKHQIKAVVAVPTAFILDHSDHSASERLKITQKQAMQNDNYKKAPFCTWAELKEMLNSNLVEVASHYHHHKSSKDHDFDDEKEILYSRKLLEEKLQIKVKTLIYPYGHFGPVQHEIACIYYRYIMRIGYALNFNWGGKQKLIYRINADPFWKQGKKITFSNKIGWFLKYLSNRLRGV